MKITIYELLGLVKDGKEPKKIKYNDIIYYLNEDMVDLHKYQTMGSNTTRKLSLIIDNEYLNLNNEVEIIEEPKKIEKLKIEQDTQNSNYYIKNEYGTKCGLTKHSKMIAEKVNELIDEINNLKEK